MTVHSGSTGGDRGEGPLEPSAPRLQGAWIVLGQGTLANRLDLRAMIVDPLGRAGHSRPAPRPTSPRPRRRPTRNEDVGRVVRGVNDRLPAVKRVRAERGQLSAAGAVSAKTLAELERASGKLASATLAAMDAQFPWFGRMPADQ